MNPKREFFEIEADQAIPILHIIGTDDVTPSVAAPSEELDPGEVEAGTALQKKRSPLNFLEMNIPIGSILHSMHGSYVAKVVPAEKVSFRDEEMSLTRATKIVLDVDWNPAPCRHWTFEGTNLTAIYADTYGWPPMNIDFHGYESALI